MFKLRVQNVAFWAVAPSLIIRYSYNQTIDERIDNLWRIHKNREEKGMGGTGQKTGNYENHNQGKQVEFVNGFHMRMDSLIHGINQKPMLDNPFCRFHENIAKYPDHQDNLDDYNLY